MQALPGIATFNTQSSYCVLCAYIRTLHRFSYVKFSREAPINETLTTRHSERNKVESRNLFIGQWIGDPEFVRVPSLSYNWAQVE